MFGLEVFSRSTHVRTGHAQLLSEFIATFGLFAVIWGCAHHRPNAVPFAVAVHTLLQHTGSQRQLPLQIPRSRRLGHSLTPSRESGHRM